MPTAIQHPQAVVIDALSKRIMNDLFGHVTLTSEEKSAVLCMSILLDGHNVLYRIAPIEGVR